MTRAVATLTELLHGYLTRDPRAKALGHATAGGGTAWLSTAELADRIRALSLGLMARGVKPGDRVALLSENRWEWMVSDFAILAAGAVTVPVHPGLSAGQMAYILGDSEALAALVSTRSLAATLMEARREVPGLATVITFDETPANGSGMSPLARALEEGRSHGEAHPGTYRRTRDAVEPGDLASLIYTSGTTGDPKGVMLTHGNFASNVTSCCNVFPFISSDLALSFLPLCHVFERTVDYCFYHSGCSVAHLPDLTRVAESFQQFRPTVFTAVPRLYEKIYARIVEQVPPSRKRLFDWAVGVGIRALRSRLAGRRVGLWLGAERRLADRLVFRRIRDALGGRIRFTISGGAPLDRSLAEFFLGAGIQVLEGYGLTETSPVIASNNIRRPKPGTVGPPLPGVEVRIAEDGEILARGALVMKGYWKSPELTARTIDADGWLSTGDIGRLDEDGYLSITDRKKEIIVTAQGKNVAPQLLENALKRAPLINQVAVVGDRRPYLVALVVPDFDLLERLGAELETGAASRAEQVRHPAVISAVKDEIRKVTVRFAHHEQIHRFLLLDRELSQEAGELTPTLKLKRRVIQKTFAEAIEALYEGHGTPRPRQN